MKKIQKKLLGDSGTSLLNFNFVKIYVIHKMLVWLKNHLNYLKYSIFKCFLRGMKDFYICLKKAFFVTYNYGKP